MWECTFVSKNSYRLKILLSPSKNLNAKVNHRAKSVPQFLEQSQKIHAELKTKTPPELAKLHDINAKLAELNYQRNQAWTVEGIKKEGTPALFTFSGDVYRGLDASTLDESDLQFAEDKIWILSGLYGILKPFDAMLPYRLEMGTDLPVGTSKNLYEFWREILTAYVEKNEYAYIINLASKEYSDVIDFKRLKIPVYECTFLDRVKNKYKPVNIFLKKARGLMARFLIKNKIEKVENLQYFDYENYTFDPKLSSEFHFVFKRDRIS
ncbi:MAG: peroxide stress protein YaaA [Thermaurantimonas sp.]|uniref:peroxide stress protein YaaA n=1 Tax=Thermaurantimonas sp. TaxID=2681568 RepID=UPI00391A4DEC